MKLIDVAIVDYGMGNLLSVQQALEYCGATVTVSADSDEILSATHVVLPGVGAFTDGMAELCKQGLDAIVKKVALRGTPLLGICLGMQMLLDESEEFGVTAGLGLIPGRVIQVPANSVDGYPQKIPHMGWNELIIPQGCENLQSTILQGVNFSEAFYFVHSFMASPSNSNHRIADCIYGGARLTAVIERDNIFGCQFHPEKGGEVGLKVLRRFLSV